MKEDGSTSDLAEKPQGRLQNHSDFMSAVTLLCTEWGGALSHSLLLVSKGFPPQWRGFVYILQALLWICIPSPHPKEFLL